MEIQKDFKEFFALFNAHKVEYVIIGGYALAFHGVPPVQVIGREALLANKRATGRAQDLADIETLKNQKK